MSEPYDHIANDVPQLRRGRVWCLKCRHAEWVNSAYCLAHGWPKHCGYTMSIDSPAERKRLAAKARKAK